MKSIKIRALLDTNVFIYAYEIPESNSEFLINALNSGVFEAVITESAFKEVYHYFRKHYHKRSADAFRVYLFAVCEIIYSHQLEEHSAEYAHLINEKDLEQVVAVKELGIKYLVSYDKHFEGIEEYRTPKQFAEILKLKMRTANY